MRPGGRGARFARWRAGVGATDGLGVAHVHLAVGEIVCGGLKYVGSQVFCGFLSLLESAGVLGTAHRELIIERAMALADFTITLNRLKVIVLMVLWQQEEPIDTLMVDELLTEEDDWAYEPTLH